jgi:hypothetical protein
VSDVVRELMSELFKDDFLDFPAPSRRELKAWGRCDFGFLRRLGFVELPALSEDTLLVWYGRGRTIKVKVDGFDMAVWVTVAGRCGLLRGGVDLESLRAQSARAIDRKALRRQRRAGYPRRLMGALAESLRRYLEEGGVS